jgi:hypothetical protein
MSDPGAKPRHPTSQLALAAVGAVIVLALAAIGVYTWRSLGDVEMDASGYVALVLGVLGTVGLGGGLMALVFYSNRYGYDDEVGGRGKPRDKR